MKSATIKLSGAATLSFPEPDWCRSHGSDGQHPVDFNHVSDSISVHAEPLDNVHGELHLLEACLQWTPYEKGVGTAQPVVVICPEGNEAFSFDLPGFTDLLHKLAAHLDQLQKLRDQLAAAIREVEEL